MKGFKTRAHTFSLGLAPSGRARCKGCKQTIEKGEARLVIHAFVRPGRSRDLVRHVGCVNAELVNSMLAAHGSIERVPAERDVTDAALSVARAQMYQLV